MPRARVRVPGRTQKKRQCRVRWGETGRSFFAKLAVSLSGRRWGRGSLARNGRVPARRRTRRFGHAALTPCNVFAPRRTTRRQRRVGLGWHRAAGRGKWARAPPCLAALPPPARQHGDPTLSAHQSGHFPSPEENVRNAACEGACPRANAKETTMPRAVGRNRVELFRKAGRLFVRAALWGGEVLREVAAPLSAAARGVSDTLPSNRAKCSLRGALRGGSAASGSACIGRQAEQNGAERRPFRPVFSPAFPRPAPASPR